MRRLVKLSGIIISFFLFNLVDLNLLLSTVLGTPTYKTANPAGIIQ